jgi:hypothetical protein
MEDCNLISLLRAGFELKNICSKVRTLKRCKQTILPNGGEERRGEGTYLENKRRLRVYIDCFGCLGNGGSEDGDGRKAGW